VQVVIDGVDEGIFKIGDFLLFFGSRSWSSKLPTTANLNVARLITLIPNINVQTKLEVS
jgi:hypothetical protein